MPPDTVLPVEVSDRFGVTKYLSKGRIRCARLRGEPSFGLVVLPDDPLWEVGANVAGHYGATKWEPPLRPSAGDAETPHPLFVEYTGIENLRNFPDVLTLGEEISVSEKLHGTSCRVGIIEGEEMAGSHRQRRKRPADDAMAGNTYWFPWTLDGVRTMLTALAADHRQVILYGEVYGPGIQSFTYGLKNAIGFRAFDLLVDGRYVGATEFAATMGFYGVPRVPVLFEGPYDPELVRKLSEGDTTIIGGDHIREGVVVRPLVERHDPKVGRVVLKRVSDEYLLKDDRSDFTEQ